MPLVPSEYTPPLLFRNGHVATIYAALLRKVALPEQERERISLPDGDFLDLDWTYSPKAASRLVVLLHGLEGNAQRPYMLGSARHFSQGGFDVCAVNLRGCSGEPNLKFRSYHSGATEDLEAVLQHLMATRDYPKTYLMGFSLGGNLILKYLGEKPLSYPGIRGAAAISVPCDLHDSLLQLSGPKNRIYARRFLTNLREKLRDKQQRFPREITDTLLSQVKSLKDFDDLYTSRAHGFRDALDYYTRCSSRQFLKGIAIPTLLINARNDSFLGPQCFPVEESREHPFLYLEMPDHGGHVGFVSAGKPYYYETRSLKFFEAHQ
ncbi:YheT family hydrolase [Robiginitalea marina]|uniref:Alpha/beta fold hydrolase n=1 Tax=Robiginitalea marina TaxID=2954105 RepID=A0ABT1AWZ8_9FLAO|nr:alpha/beta fold hydrolase [Robiginitalea marina]MCO5724449.1 alpha/beta fold hydrolase [Robiginitalea marina]